VTAGSLQAVGLAFVTTVAVTLGVLYGSRRWRFLDTPNDRSAHSIPTPTMGGIGISAGVAGGLLTAPVPSEWSHALLAVLGLLLLAVFDDFGQPLGAGRKLLLQILAAVSWVYLSPATSMQLIGDWVLPSGPVNWVISVLWLLAMMNVFNFMDGIDGLTTTQVAAMSLAFALLLPAGSAMSPVTGVLVAACVGFLFFNRPPARIFMGDVGSLSLGFLVGAMSLYAAGEGLPMWLAAMPLAAYLVDTSYTIIRRLQQGENLLQAHNQHLYQRLVQSGWSHLRVDGAALATTTLFSAAAIFYAHQAIFPALACALAGSSILGIGLLWKERRRRE
jgi:UDP-N-acetylmuramyl pentapeptide phosphotransferase/UDP-N-acetylglucosamine-1-phosphate transferase